MSDEKPLSVFPLPFRHHTPIQHSHRWQPAKGQRLTVCVWHIYTNQTGVYSIGFVWTSSKRLNNPPQLKQIINTLPLYLYFSCTNTCTCLFSLVVTLLIAALLKKCFNCYCDCDMWLSFLATLRWSTNSIILDKTKMCVCLCVLTVPRWGCVSLCWCKAAVRESPSASPPPA